ncbi:MAG: TonB-dependent receptor, partial [Deltaproteobacteria bacterium]|nr:TonB-dependent receptor [Deltaproteobacteria bacterium]
VQPLTESPSAITVLTRQDIEASGARTLPEALRLVPNMDIYLLKPLWYAVGVRGRTSEESDKMLLLVDGRDVTAELIGAPLWTTQHFSMDEVERIEIIRGPGSALYGANAYSGVVHVITRRPGSGPKISAALRGGEHSLFEANARASERFGSLALSVNAGLVQEDLWTGRDINARRIFHSRLNSEIEFTPDSVLVLDTGFLRAEGLVHSALGEIQLRNMLNFFSRVRFEYHDLTIQAIYDRTSLDLKIDLALYLKELDLTLATVPPINGLVDKLTFLTQHVLEGFHNRITYGAEYVFNRYSADVLVNKHHYEHRIGIFAQVESNLDEIIEDLWDVKIPTLILNIGLRFDYNKVSEWDDWELSPRAALVFMPNKNHSLRLGFAHAFLKPTFLQSSLHFKVNDVSSLGFEDLNMANPDLKNQTIDSLELGYNGNFFEGVLTLKLDLAYNWYQNNIWFSIDEDRMSYIQVGTLRVPDISGEGIGFTNLAEGSNGHDIELQVIIRPSDRTRLFVQAGYRQVFENKSGNFSEFEPVWRFAAGGDLGIAQGWTMSIRAFFTDGCHRYLSSPDGILGEDIRVKIPANWFLNARIAYSFRAGAMELTTGLEGFNMLNFRFRELGGRALPNEPDLNAEMLGRKFVLFLQGNI